MGFCAICPVLAILAIDSMRRRRRAGDKPPQKEKLLRPAGYSCSLRLDEAEYNFIGWLLGATAACSFAGAMVLITSAYIKARGFAALAWVPGVSLLASALLTGECVRRALKKINDGRNLRLGLRGEQAVAEVLHEVADCGFHAFHDLQRGGKSGNIDHVAVGPQGVFVIETKAKTMRRSRSEQPRHVVLVNGDVLNFAFGYDADAIPQAQDNVDWLSDHLSKKTAEPVEAQAIVVLPGSWWIEQASKTDSKVAVMNANYLAKYLRGKTKKVLEPAQVQRIVAELDEKCRDVEF